MTRLVAYIVRFAVILFGYAVAALAASAFLNILFLASLGYAPAQAHPAAAASLYFSIPFVALFVAYFGFMPAAVVILIAEILGRRDWLFYALAGALVAGVFLGLVDNVRESAFAVTETSAIMAVIGGGMVGGIFYWLSAGRWAGSWWEVEKAPTSPGQSGS
ncbi:hypothetical protein EN794_050020 [Mesorhizobium sp. M00.F.Ca.ET.151.01.1.1]|uniref:hypothetical protein n=1 Tax=unclassified Mesorhizobium TaxID=325217 RepID=UPI000FDBB50E|nr:MULTISPECIES: hypothetical protein [unclassified Mesorhizobium]RWC67793.1 MAG: hypothetical protein EOS30_27355 [Mesorhizobium sp.]TGR38660.1 hypothetical protein EN842_44665 [bacterium M00.F.Ca.ET.199.01.1.1]TGU28124.1 hypothetical protein EN799_38540 [bacterium M00.F.Ca.ET.156.01.1.1]TGU88119.1 hypothetical protein EN794_050020 [Mesorhizobium sp. M00.F.Ca.ET.151.01.1.1]TGV52789.1 hypothetical protein EN784_44550 [bacterium M00.F.Ca.ET.141.01.1.1]TGV83658.1 hypothetical protein EN792_0249